MDYYYFSRFRRAKNEERSASSPRSCAGLLQRGDSERPSLDYATASSFPSDTHTAAFNCRTGYVYAFIAIICRFRRKRGTSIVFLFLRLRLDLTL
jgi:hypothetical protein